LEKENTTIELLKERIRVLQEKLEEQREIAVATKKQCELHYKKNVEAVAQFEAIMVRIEENEEMIKILEGSA